MCNKLFREYRYCFISALFPLVSPEDGDVDRTIKEMENSTKKICSNETCNRIFEGMKKTVVTIKLSKFADCSTDVGIDSRKERHLIMKMTEPVMLNPNSYTNVENILLNLKKSADIGKSCEWVFWGCDGPPYCLAQIIANYNPTKFSFASSVSRLGH